jgi:NH3-dependent NAD+ synthetase
MRYDKLLHGLEKATARYEAEVRGLLHKFAKADTHTADALMGSMKSKRNIDIDDYVRAGQRQLKKRKKLHWTQRPENKARVRKQIKRAIAAKKAAKSGA